MPDCRDCQFFRKETIEFERTGESYNTWINFEDPTKPGSGAYDIAQCSNPLTTNGIISRDASTAFFFNPLNPYAAIFGEQPTAGELDECTNFTAI